MFQDLEQLAAELRANIVSKVSKTGGHLSSSLGVVELTVALHQKRKRRRKAGEERKTEKKRGGRKKKGSILI